jgi:hypothetical protein
MNTYRRISAFAVVFAFLVVAPAYGEEGAVAAQSCATAQSFATAQSSPSDAATLFDEVSAPVLLSSPPPVYVSLSCSSNCIGDKTRYACTATGSGGYGSQWYAFSWSGANPTSGSGDNPNYAYRTMTPGGPCQDVIQVWLTDGCSTDDASRTIYDFCDSSCRFLP